MKGVFIQGGVKNQNQRVYPISEISNAVANIKERLNQGYSVLGEADHPENLTVNLDRVSHMITDMWMDGPNGLGKLKIMPTPMGKIVQNIMDDGGKLAVSSRGMGSLTKKNGANYVNDDFYLATAADIVADPSATNAFVDGIMEGKESVWSNRLLQEQEVARIKDEMEQNIRSRKANYQALAFAKFLKNL